MLADARDHALLLVGWKAALRTQDLARLQMAALHSSEQSLSVYLSRSKTDQHGAGTTIGIAAPSPAPVVGEGSSESTLLDAGAAWTCWRDLLGSHDITEGPAWRGIDRYGRPALRRRVQRNSIAEIIKRRAAAAGSRTPTCGAGTACDAGSPPKSSPPASPNGDVQRHGCWRFSASMDPYIATARTSDPTNPTHWLT